MAFDFDKYTPPQAAGALGTPGLPVETNRVQEDFFTRRLANERQITEVEQEKRFMNADTALSLWASGKKKEKDLFAELNKLQLGATGETEKKKWAVIMSGTKEKVITRNLENKERETKSSYFQGKLGLNDAYKQYSGLARTAALAGLTELSTILMLNADMFLRQMKDDLKGTGRDADLSFLKDFFNLDDDQSGDEQFGPVAPTPLPQPELKPPVYGPGEKPEEQSKVRVNKLPPAPELRVVPLK